MGYIGLYRGYIGIMEKKMETTIMRMRECVVVVFLSEVALNNSQKKLRKK